MKSIRMIINGILIGVANLVPGISGGTIAYMLGIYEDLINVISDFIPNKQNKRNEYIKFLLLIGSGLGIGIVGFAKVFEFITTKPSLEQHLFFFIIGSIVGSICIMISTEDTLKPSLRKGIVFLASIIIFLLIANLNSAESAVDLEVTGKFLGIFNLTNFDLKYFLWIFVIGIVAAGSMVVPGFSGSALLLTLGEYDNVLMFVSERMIYPLVFLGLGCIAGVIILSKIISIMFAKFRGETNYLIIGLMVASVIKILSDILASLIINQLIISMIIGFIGFIVSYKCLGKKE